MPSVTMWAWWSPFFKDSDPTFVDYEAFALEKAQEEHSFHKLCSTKSHKELIAEGWVCRQVTVTWED